MLQCADHSLSLVLVYRKLVIVGFAITFCVAYCCVAFSTRSDIQSVSASFLRILECHALLNIRTSKLDSKDHFPSLCVRYFRTQLTHLVLLAYFARLYLLLSDLLSWLVRMATHWYVGRGWALTLRSWSTPCCGYRAHQWLARLVEQKRWQTVPLPWALTCSNLLWPVSQRCQWKRRLGKGL